MTKRSPLAVFLFAIISLGFYSWYWLVKTKTELNQRGAKIPTCWIWLIPIVGGIWWYWKYSEGVEAATNGKSSTVGTFVLLILLGPIGQAVAQSAFNTVP